MWRATNNHDNTPYQDIRSTATASTTGKPRRKSGEKYINNIIVLHREVCFPRGKFPPSARANPKTMFHDVSYMMDLSHKGIRRERVAIYLAKGTPYSKPKLDSSMRDCCYLSTHCQASERSIRT